jgi:hypothetical protein
MDLNINNERQDYKIDTVCVRGTCGKGEGEWRLRWGYIVDGLHILTWKRTKKPPTTALSGTERGLRGETCRGDVNNV